MGKAKKIASGIGITFVAAFVIFLVISTMEYNAIIKNSQVLDEMLAECNEKHPTQAEELRDCKDGAEEKWREMFSDSPCLFLCSSEN